MSLQKLKEAYPNEVTPTHYEVWANPRGLPLHDQEVNNGDQHHPFYIGHFDNLADAHRAALDHHYAAFNIAPMDRGYYQLNNENSTRPRANIRGSLS